MSAVFVDRVTKLKVADRQSLTNVVCVALYHITCSYRGESLDNIFEVELSPPDPSNFVGFDQLNEAQVLAWVRSEIGSQAIQKREEAMKTMIDQIIVAKTDDPKEVSLPWGNS